MSVILVTGLRGFLGRHCIRELLEHGHEVHGVTRHTHDAPSGVHWHGTDLHDRGQVETLVRNVRAENLLHFAWIAQPPIFWTSGENLEWVASSLHLIKAFREAGGSRTVVAGSCAEYAFPTAGPRMEDSSPIQPATLYGAAKAALHDVLRAYARQTSLALAWGRIFFIYGRGEPSNRIISTLIGNARTGESTTIREPYRRLDYIDVRDAARAFVMLLESNAQGTFNVGSGHPTTMLEVLATLDELLGRDVPIDIAQPQSNNEPSSTDLYADTTRLRELLGFRCRYSLREGIAEMLSPS